MPGTFIYEHMSDPSEQTDKPTNQPVGVKIFLIDVIIHLQNVNNHD